MGGSVAGTRPQASGPAPVRAAGRAFLGLALLGWGSSILLGVVPHEDLVVGAGLSVFGAALVATARAFPRFPDLPAPLVLVTGLALAAGTLAHGVVGHAPIDGPKLALVALGLALCASAPFLRRSVRFGWRGRHGEVHVSTLVVCAFVILAAPLAVWTLQATFKTAFGTTPVEWFVRVALLPPLGAFLGILGLEPSLEGQTLTYMTPRGPLALEVGAACSGIQAMALFAGVLALYLAFERPGGRRLAAWSVIGLVGVYLTNLLRLAVLAVVGYWWGSPALLTVHAEAGWVFFVAWALVFAWLARRSSDRARRRAASP